MLSILKKKIVMAWSGGKDCSLALYKLKNSLEYKVVGLLSTVIDELEIIGMHNIGFSLIEKQAESIGIPVYKIVCPKNNNESDYHKNMTTILNELKKIDVVGVAFGDIFLEELRASREKMLVKAGMIGVFPLWKADTNQLPEEFIAAGFRAKVINIDTHFVDKQWLGKDFDQDFLINLSDKTDKCGENGEFHTFSYYGPIFNKKIEFEFGDISCDSNRFYSLNTKTVTVPKATTEISTCTKPRGFD